MQNCHPPAVRHAAILPIPERAALTRKVGPKFLLRPPCELPDKRNHFPDFITDSIHFFITPAKSLLNFPR